MSAGGAGNPAPPGQVRHRRSAREAAEALRQERIAKQNAMPPAVLTEDDLDNPSALVEAANRKDERRCRALIAHKDFNGINEKDSERRSTLHVAALRRLSQDLCMSILKHPDFTEINCVDQFGHTVLSTAASTGMKELRLAILENEDF